MNKTPKAGETLYTERYRPQFHFTAKKNWLNDPNGCVFHNGEYHLFFQHNPTGLEWGNMTWGHAVSPDLVHWRQLPHALLPYDDGAIYSGSAVSDSKNLSGLGRASHGPLVAAFTHAKKPFGQVIAFSNDNGRNWKLYSGGKPVVPNQGLDEGERDPKIFWHELSQKWIMALWVQKGRIRFFTSDNFLQWQRTSDFFGEGFFECPDIFQLPLDGDEDNMKWVLHDAAFNYWICSFNGKTFVPESGPILGDDGSNFYAAQTWNNTGSRVIQIGWMNGGEYPDMPFNQQMSFPCELSLRTTVSGVRLHRMPVREIESLYIEKEEFIRKTLQAGEELSFGSPGDLFDIQIEAKVSPDTSFSISFRDQAITYSDGEIQCLGKSAPLMPVNGAITLRILVDRTSIELFGNKGELSMSSCFLPSEIFTNVRCRVETGDMQIRDMNVYRLASAWV